MGKTAGTPLLIEPYGIETNYTACKAAPAKPLLIEPYGIETSETDEDFQGV